MKWFDRRMWVALSLAGAVVVGCISEAPESLIDSTETMASDGDLAARPKGPPVGGGPFAGVGAAGAYGDNSNFNGGANGNDNGGANGNDNGGANGNDNGGANGNDNGGTNGNDNGGANGNDNGGTNGNDNGGTNGNDNGGTNGNDNGGANGNDNGGGGGACPDGSTQLFAPMSGDDNNEAEYRNLVAGCERFRVRVRALAPFTTYAVDINGVVVGMLTTDDDGRGELRYDSSDGNFPPDFPFIQAGDVVSVGPVSGVFGLDCSSNANCNG